MRTHPLSNSHSLTNLRGSVTGQHLGLMILGYEFESRLRDKIECEIELESECGIAQSLPHSHTQQSDVAQLVSAFA